MFKRILFIFSFLSLSLLFLYGSIFRSSSVLKYSFTLSAQEASETQDDVGIDYVLPYQGKILPDSPIWFMKVVRDRIQLFFTKDNVKRSELNLLFSDKRLVSSKILFEREKPELASSTLEKAEKYLEKAYEEEKTAREDGKDTTNLVLKIANASLKHRVEIEEAILPLVPADLKPEIIKSLDYSKRIYNELRNALLDVGMEPPNNPFEE